MKTFRVFIVHEEESHRSNRRFPFSSRARGMSPCRTAAPSRRVDSLIQKSALSGRLASTRWPCPVIGVTSSTSKFADWFTVLDTVIDNNTNGCDGSVAEIIARRRAISASGQEQPVVSVSDGCANQCISRARQSQRGRVFLK